MIKVYRHLSRQPGRPACNYKFAGVSDRPLSEPPFNHFLPPVAFRLVDTREGNQKFCGQGHVSWAGTNLRVQALNISIGVPVGDQMPHTGAECEEKRYLDVKKA